MIPASNPSKPGKSKVVPILLTVVCGLLLAGGSCFGFINTLNFNGHSKPMNTVYAVGLAAGVVAVLAGCIWAIVAFVRFLLRQNKEPS